MFWILNRPNPGKERTPVKKQWTLLAAVGAVVMSGVMFFSQRDVDAQSASGPTAVAVVDLNNVINGSKQFQSLQAEQQSRDASRAEEAQSKQAELEKLKADLDLLAPGTPAHENKTRDLLEKAAAAQGWNSVAQQLENSRRSREFLALYESANKASAAVAQDRGLDIVLATGQLPDMQQLARAEAQQIAAILQNRKVIYNKANVDITQAVLTRMNADFDAK